MLENLRPILVSEAIRRNTSKWVIHGDGFKDPEILLESTTSAVDELINSTDSVGKKVHVVLVCKMVRTDPETGRDVITIAHFRSKTHSMISEEDVRNEYPVMKEKMLENLSKYQKLGSGWRLYSIERLEIFITKFKLLGGKSYKPFPKTITKKKAVINMENNDDQCFKWATTRALHPVDDHPQRITKMLKTQAKEYNWDDIEFPTKVRDICKFEKNNGINVNVFSYDETVGQYGAVYTLRLSKTNCEKTIDLFLYDEHYGVVKNLSRLVSSQLSKHKIPFVVYADFECFIESIDNKIGKGTVQYQKHMSSGFCYTIKCMEESAYKTKTVLYTAKENGEDIDNRFVESLENDLKEVYEILKTAARIKISEQEEEGFKAATVCYACEKELDEINRVRDHCHLTGKYRGAAHNKCNLLMKAPKFVPVLFHNLEGYDSHLFVKSLGYSEGKISCIPKTDEKYISFSKRIVMEETIVDHQLG